ncbi:MAG: sporulation protein YqfD [Clostridiales bacterium]|nr:sporulation protein YqfD [Clostridiales bacterium]
MQSFRIWILFRGYVIIRVEGKNIEKFINICVHRKILLMDINRHREYTLLKMSVVEFKKIRDIIKKTHCSVKVIDKRGLCFWFKKYKKRKSFLIGSVVFVSVFMLMWSYIWDIEIKGYEKERKVIEYLNSKNIRVGILKYFVDVNRIEYELIMNFKDLSWADVKIQGTKLVINLSKRAKVPKIINTDIPCNIVAKRDGIITRVLVKNGIENVKVGDTVLKGDVLISGMIIGDESDYTKVVRAIGVVTAKTTYEQREEVKCVKKNKVYSGKVSNEYRFCILGKEVFKVVLGKGTDKYDEVTNIKKVRVLKNFVMPFEIKEKKKRYYKEKEEVLPMSLARERALSEAKKKILECIPKNVGITGQDVEYFENEGRIFVSIKVYVHEDIGEEELIY